MRAFARNPLDREGARDGTISLEGPGRMSPSAALPISALQRARARNSACKESSRRERHSTDAYSDSDQSAQPRERASIYRPFSALLAKEPSAEFLAQAANLAPTVQGELGEYFAALRGCDIEQARGDAASDFAALLLNMSPNPVIAYESVCTSEEGLLMQDARDADSTGASRARFRNSSRSSGKTSTSSPGHAQGRGDGAAETSRGASRRR